MSPTYQRILVLGLLTLGYLLSLYLFFRPVQAAIQNEISGLNLFTMTYLVVPFMVVRIAVTQWPSLVFAVPSSISHVPMRVTSFAFCARYR